jgi:hypothetical protein
VGGGLVRTLLRNIEHPLKEQNVRFGCVDFVMLPSQTLSNTKASPFLLVQNLEGTRLAVEIVLGDLLEHVLG